MNTPSHRWLAILLLLPMGAFAHPGRTAEDGCHHDGDERHCHGTRAEVPHARWARETVFVYEVVDGDTVKVRTLSNPSSRYLVRFLGLDCPERGQPGGRDATTHVTRRLLKKTVVLQSGGARFERDRYGRTLAYVERVGVDIGRELIDKGLCRDYSHRYPHPRQDRYLSAQAAADGG